MDKPSREAQAAGGQDRPPTVVCTCTFSKYAVLIRVDFLNSLVATSYVASYTNTEQNWIASLQ